MALAAGHTARLGDTRKRGRSASQELLDVEARVRVDDVGAGGCLARIDGVEVRDEEFGVIGGAANQVVTAAAAAAALTGRTGRGYGDGRAVHVILRLAGELRDPSPCETVLAGREVLRNGPVVRADIGAVGAGATALYGQDNTPVGVGARLHVVSDGELAAAAAVDGGALEGEGLDAAGGVGVVDARLRVEGGGIAGHLARVVGAGERRVVDGLVAVGDGVCHDHVGARLGCEEGDDEDHLGDEFVGMRYVHVD